MPHYSQGETPAPPHPPDQLLPSPFALACNRRLESCSSLSYAHSWRIIFALVGLLKKLEPQQDSLPFFISREHNVREHLDERSAQRNPPWLLKLIRPSGMIHGLPDQTHGPTCRQFTA